MQLEKFSLAALLATTLLAIPPGVHAAENRKSAAKPPAASSVANNAARAEQETDLAAQAYQAGDYPVAIEHFNKVVKLAPNDVMAWHFLGQSLAKTGDVMGARRAYARVLELQPEGQVADRTRELLAKLPEPDLFKIQLDSGLTLGDWLPVAQQQAAQGKREAVLREIAQYLKQIGPVPQLLALQDKLNKEVQAEQEQRIGSAISALKVKDADTAKAALPQIRQLKSQAPGNLTLLRIEAKACHLMQDFACAEAAYAAWLKAAPGNDGGRKQMVAALMQAKQHEALSSVRQEREFWQRVVGVKALGSKRYGDDGRSMAMVNGISIPQSELDKRIKIAVAEGQIDSTPLRREIREDLINIEVVVQEAIKSNLDVSDDLIQQSLNINELRAKSKIE